MFTKIKSYVALILCAILLSSYFIVPAEAAMRASSIIANHSCEASAAGGGKIAVTFSISAKNTVSRLGAKSMYFYASENGKWILKESYNQYDAGMSCTNDGIHGNTINYQGVSEVRYKVVVTLFATNSSGTTDTRNDTLYVTA